MDFECRTIGTLVELLAGDGAEQQFPIVHGKGVQLLTLCIVEISEMPDAWPHALHLVDGGVSDTLSCGNGDSRRRRAFL